MSPKKGQLESAEYGPPSISAFAAVSWTKSIANRSGASIVPLIANVAPRWAVRPQQPLPTSQRSPRSGGATSIAGSVPTAVFTPVNVCAVGGEASPTG